ncbi:MAG: hypothetical protein WDN49_21705 [Acetobacteraceae bacterium]
MARTGSAALERDQRLTAPTRVLRVVPADGAPPEGDGGVGADRSGRRAPMRWRWGRGLFHQKFGYGTVRSVSDDRLDVAFDKAGDKRVLDRFVERA